MDTVLKVLGVIFAFGLPILIFAAIAFVVFVLIPMMFRTVVATNSVDIVQRGRTTTTYGKDLGPGNVYYKWPSWVPYIGVMVTPLPTSVYSLSLKDYAAYDQGRVPFIIDIIGFFRVEDPLMASSRIATFDELKAQMTGILQGAIRSILAGSEIEKILEGRAEFGVMFTHAVDEQLKNWGITSVKTVELMDIRDASGSNVIANIMAKKQSLIQMQSRMEVAANMQAAETREVEAHRQVELAKQEAAQQVNVRTAEQKRATEVAAEVAMQAVADQRKTTAEKNMEVQQVNDVRAAEIAKAVQVVQADQQKQVDIVKAEGSKQQAILIAAGAMEGKKLEAEGIRAVGEAEGAAELAMQMAPVTAQINLAKEIGSNAGYQTYLVSVRTIEANQAVGMEQAKAITAADIKVIANSGDIVGGVDKVMDLFSSKGGTAIAAAIEAFGQTDAGKSVLGATGLAVDTSKTATRPMNGGGTSGAGGGTTR
jgi:flotillin